MYTPTQRQLFVYGLKNTETRLYTKTEICAGLFRANKGRECKATLPGGIVYEGHIYIDNEGGCYIARVFINEGIFVYTSDKDDLENEQNKIIELIILPMEISPEEIPEKNAEVQDLEGNFEIPLPPELIEKIQRMKEMGHGKILMASASVSGFIVRMAFASLTIFLFVHDEYFIAGIFLFLYGHVSHVTKFVSIFLKAILKK